MIEARGLKSSWSDMCDGFCFIRANKVILNNIKELKTVEIEDNLNPKWDFTGNLTFRLTEEELSTLKLIFEVRDKDNLGSDFIG